MTFCLTFIFLFRLVLFVNGLYENTNLYNQTYYDYLNEQKLLIDDVFRDYDPTVSPIFTIGVFGNTGTFENITTPNRWNYTTYLYYLKLLEVDEPTEKVSAVMELMEFWYDARLAWDPKKYKNIPLFYARQEKVWSPTLSAFGVNDIQDFRDQDFRLVAVVNFGYVYTYIPLRISVNCPLNMKLFPFDKQSCQIKLCLPIFDHREVQILNEVYDGITTEAQLKLMGNSEWKITKLIGMTDVLHYHNDSLTDMQFSVFQIDLERNPMYYFYMIILPSFIINSVSIVGIFLKGADKMSRLNVGITNIMTMTFILGVMADKIPRTGAIPLLGIYIIVNLAIMILSIVVIVCLGKFRKWMKPKLVDKKDRTSELLQYFIGRPLEIVIVVILFIINIANFLVMIFIWIFS